MKKIVLIALSLLLFACNPHTNLSSEKQNEYNRDIIEYVYENLKKNHKNIYANIDEREFEKSKDKIKEKVAKMENSKEKYNGVLELVSLVKDSHTRASYTGDDLEYILYNMVFYEDGWRLSSIDNENEKYLGQKVVGFNELSIEDFEKIARKIVSYDNEVQFRLTMPNLVNTKAAFEYLGIIEEGEEVFINLEDDNGNVSKVELKIDISPQGNFLGDQPDKLPKTSPSGYYRSFDIDEKNLFIQYNLCKEEESYPMKKFTNDIEGFLKKYKFENIIIDLRYNPGGNSRILDPFINMLRKNREGRNFFVLVGPNTFSSAILNSIDLKESLNATIVGSPTGGSINHYGEVKTFEIPNEPIVVTYSTKYFELDSEFGVESLIPDVEIPLTYENFKEGIDSEVEYILENY